MSPVGAARVSRNSLGNVIPDSAIHQWRFDEGGGTTVADSIGTADGTLNGSVGWASGTWVGGYSLDSPGGTSDYVETTTWGDFGSTLFPASFSIATTVQSTSDGAFYGTLNDSDDMGLRTSFGVDPSVSSGEIEFWRRDGAANSQRIYTAGSSFNDGSKHRLVVVSRGARAEDLEIHVDGSQISTATQLDNGDMSNVSDFEFPVSLFAQNVRGSITQAISATMDDPIVFNDALSASQIQEDYDRQPWS